MYGHGIWLIFWIVVIIAIIWLIMAQTGSRKKYINHFDAHQKTPMDILNEKYAKGEINKEEYDQKRKDLE